eukprot:6264284-Amphidinium_carterae.4
MAPVVISDDSAYALPLYAGAFIWPTICEPGHAFGVYSRVRPPRTKNSVLPSFVLMCKSDA